MNSLLIVCFPSKDWEGYEMDKNKVNCYKCKFYYVTWDSQFPKGCKAFQFKGRTMPSVEVKRASGQECLRFQAKGGMK